MILLELLFLLVENLLKVKVQLLLFSILEDALQALLIVVRTLKAIN